jgi:group I intron endonuclease
MIINLTTGYIYVGSTTKHLKKRWQVHTWSINNSSKKERPLYKAIAEYGKEDFEIFVLEYFPCDNEETLRMRETYWQDRFRSRDAEYGYNIVRAYSSTETTKQTKHEYNIASREKYREYQREWRDRNIETQRQKDTEKMRKWREKNREHYNQYQRERRKRITEKINI